MYFSLALSLLSACTREASLSSQENDCLFCHIKTALISPMSREDLGPKEWLVASGAGLAKTAPFVPAGPESLMFRFSWPKRGRHPDMTPKECSMCHPLKNGVEGHTRRMYPAGGDGNCSSSCHSWLSENITTRGFTDSTGQIATYTGSIRPEVLLSSGRNKHAAIYSNGLRITRDDPTLKIRFVPPGCRGCHNLFVQNKHGSITMCPDCHNFDQGLSTGEHAHHVTLIQTGRSLNDPAHSTEPTCVYCHGKAGRDPALSGPVCYNCHLSGHSPLPIFWR